jgi:ADP-heptose:LPS heptosyltransferase
LAKPAGELPAGLQEGRYTVLQPYSLWTTKLWAWSNYSALARLLPEEKFVLVGTGAFFPIDEPNVVDLRNRTTLAELLLVLSNARVVVGTDSGPLHLAAAFDTPLLALFGATDPRKTAPRSAHTNVLTTDLECRPCLRRQCRRQNVMECLQSITPSRVAAAWKEIVTKM